MPSPFPGMDPFIEGQEWEDFHHGIITALQEALVPQVRPRYVVRVEKRVYLEHTPQEQAEFVRSDVLVLGHEQRQLLLSSGGGTATALADAPIEITLPMPEERREAFLSILTRDKMEVVTLIEVLTPSHKRPGSDGRKEYLEKREAVLRSSTHLVEIDLLRAGARLPTIEALPTADYFAFVSRKPRRPKAELHRWTLRDRLPTIGIPLLRDDPDVPLGLQVAFEAAYDRAGYDYSLDYRRPVEPPLTDADAAWAREVLAAVRGS
jgi:Protein of unknown function (DUF4058)